MLFPYKYVPHQMEQMQRFINFIFYQVWCRASKSGPFCLDLFDANPKLKSVMHDFYFVEPQPKGAKFFCGHIERIYQLFSSLPRSDIKQFKRWYQGNNDIDNACAADLNNHVVRYKEIFSTHPVLGRELASFFRGLYDKDLLNLAVLRSVIGKMSDHNRAFFGVNNLGKCPFCGISDLKGIHHTRREAYDHYLPQYRYPFNSINFHNLAPACHECNSTYKLSKDPLNSAAGRRRAFYPYANVAHSIDIKVELGKPDVDHLTPDDVQLEFGPAVLSEQIETWKDVYGIEERYKAKCCTESDGKYWLTQVIDEWQEDGRSPANFLRTLARHTTKAPFTDNNFLKKAFLEGCDRVGIFSGLGA